MDQYFVEISSFVRSPVNCPLLTVQEDFKLRNHVEVDYSSQNPSKSH